MVNVQAQIVRIATLSSDQLSMANIESITGARLSSKEAYYFTSYAIDEHLAVRMQFAQHDSDNLTFLIEFIPTLPLPKEMDQKSVNAHMEKLAKFQKQAIQSHCIPQEQLFNTLLRNGWTPFETNLSPSPADEEGNFYFSSAGGRYMTLTIDGRCLEQFTISKGWKYPAYSGIPKSKN